MEVRCTVPVKLEADRAAAALLRETVDEFLWAANHVVGHAWQGESSDEHHADYNGAKNIGLRSLRPNQTGTGGGAPVGVRLNRGTVSADGAYEPPGDASGLSGSPRENLTRNEANGDAVSE